MVFIQWVWFLSKNHICGIKQEPMALEQNYNNSWGSIGAGNPWRRSLSGIRAPKLPSEILWFYAIGFCYKIKYTDPIFRCSIRRRIQHLSETDSCKNFMNREGTAISWCTGRNIASIRHHSIFLLLTMHVYEGRKYWLWNIFTAFQTQIP